MSAVASQMTDVSIVCSTVCSGAHQRKTSKLGVTGLCKGNPPVTGGFPTQRASNAENVSIWWRHHWPYNSAVAGSIIANAITPNCTWTSAPEDLSVNTESGNGLVLTGNKPLPASLLIQFCFASITASLDQNECIWIPNLTPFFTWWLREVETLSVSLALGEGNPPVILDAMMLMGWHSSGLILGLCQPMRDGVTL